MSTSESTKSLGKQCAGLARRFHVVGATTPAMRRDSVDALRKRGMVWTDTAALVACEIDLGGMRCADVLERPASMTQDDLEILKRLRKLREQARELSISDRDWLRRYHGWMDDLREAEGQNQGNVVLMLNVIARCADDDPSCSRIREHLQAEYQWAGPARYRPEMVHNDVLAVTRRTDIVPTWLLTGSDPKGVFVPSPKGADHEAEDMPGWMK